MAGRSTESLGVSVEALYKCNSCDEKFGVRLEPGAVASPTQPCLNCDKPAPLQSVEPAKYRLSWGEFLGIDLIWWFIIAVASSVGVAVFK